MIFLIRGATPMNKSTTINPDEPRFTIPVFADKVGIGKTSARQLVHQRKVASMRIGRKIFIPESALVAYLSECYCPAFDAETKLDEGKSSAILKTARRKVAEAI
jgi:hypothetical protein